MRPALDIGCFGEEPRDWLLAHGFIPEDLVDAYSGRLPLSNVRYQPAFAAVPEAERAARFPQTMRTIGCWPVFTDPPLHTRLRKLLTRAFGRWCCDETSPLTVWWRAR